MSGRVAPRGRRYRLVATSAPGTSFGGVASFTTTGAAQAPGAVTLAATSVTTTAATLHSQVNPNGEATAFTFEYGTTLAFGSISAIDVAGATNRRRTVSLPIGGLAPGTTYRYRIVATNANGTTTGSVASFTTAASSRGRRTQR